MSASLRQKVDQLASSFAHGVLHAIRNASIDDLRAGWSGGKGGQSQAPRTSAPAATAPRPSAGRGGRRRGGRLGRRSAKDIAGVIERIIELLKQSAEGLRAEQIRKKLGLLAKELPRPLKEALASGHLVKSGQKRATTYAFKGAGGGAASAAPAKKARKARKAKKAGKARTAKKQARKK